MLGWCIIGCICFAVIVIIIAKNYCHYYCDEISNILSEILAKKATIVSTHDCNSRMSKLIHQANKITEMVELECTNAYAEKEYVKSLISDISHQLKSPLSNIIVYSELLEQRDLSDENRTEFMKRHKEEISKIDWLVKSLLNMSRLESGVIDFKTEELPIKETIIQSISRVFGDAYKKNIEIILDDFEDKKLIHNRKWTTEALTNILENAVKYSAAGTSVTVGFEPREIYSRIIVSDQGMGIEQREFNDIFKRFYRSDNVKNYQGAGIGLYLSRLILLKEGGNITVQSNITSGSSFSVFLQNCKNP